MAPGIRARLKCWVLGRGEHLHGGRVPGPFQRGGAEVIALQVFYAAVAQCLGLFFGLHAFTDHLGAEALRQI